jgi:hypothetical protein
MATSKVSLSELIRQLKSEVIAAQNSEDEEMFSLQDVTITTKFIVEASEKAGGKLDLWVVTVDADVASKGQVSHELTVKLSPINPVYMGKQKEGQ